MSATQVWIKEQFEKESRENPTTDVWSLKREINQMHERMKQLETDIAYLLKERTNVNNG